MKIILHRVNTIEGVRGLDPKYGVEIDIRAKGDRLILNHEPHQDGDDFEEYLKVCGDRFVVFNIKEAGIEDEVVSLAAKYGVKDFFLLDVEFPYIYRATRKDGFKKIAVRFSEAEPIEMSLAQEGLLDWVWVDTNTQLPLDKEVYDRLKKAGFKLCLVCPERWGRPEDISNYKNKMSEAGFEIDAVMTAKKYVDEWTK